MGSILRTLAALVTGALAALVWVEQRQPTRAPERAGEDSARPPAAAVERVEVPVADPEQTERISALEAELAAERSRREAAPDEPPPTVDAIRAARARSFALERELALRDNGPEIAHWTVNAPVSTSEIADAAAEHLPEVAWHIVDTAAFDSAAFDVSALWSALGAMQEFAIATDSDWFEHHGDFAGWCRESGHPHAYEGDGLGEDPELPSFDVPAAVNRSRRMVVRNYVLVGERRLYYVDDLGGETGRMHIVGVG